MIKNGIATNVKTNGGIEMTNSTHSQISLKVEDGYPRDTARGIIRIDYDSMDALDVSTGDLVEITGKRTTLVSCLPVYPSDDGKGIVRTDKIVQNNAQVSTGNIVTIRKAQKNISEHVTVLPLQQIPPGMENYLKDALDSVPVLTGDEIAVRYFGKLIYFEVINATPSGVISQDVTTFEILQDKKSGDIS